MRPEPAEDFRPVARIRARKRPNSTGSPSNRCFCKQLFALTVTTGRMSTPASPFTLVRAARPCSKTINGTNSTRHSCPAHLLTAVRTRPACLPVPTKSSECGADKCDGHAVLAIAVESSARGSIPCDRSESPRSDHAGSAAAHRQRHIPTAPRVGACPQAPASLAPLTSHIALDYRFLCIAIEEPDGRNRVTRASTSHPWRTFGRSDTVAM